MIRRLLLSAFSLLCALFSFAQVTTSAITGTVKDTKGAFLSNATITAVHEPSGTRYITISKTGGVFNLPGLRSGGPYKVTVGYVGYKDQVLEGINLTLGDAFTINIEMNENAVDLSTVTVTGTRKRNVPSGASTNISAYQLSTLPTVSRSITDFTRVTPQANGNSFAGRDGRMNNVTVDGANLNNNFGLSSDLLPGAGNPIALDAFQEISVNISPFDVKQSGFTGAGVSAITKSGTNTFHGSAYWNYRNQSFNGTNVAGTKLPSPAKTNNKIYGATLGGAIIKNKLFFFVSGELEQNSKPGVTFYPSGGSGNGTKSNVPVDSLIRLSNYLQKTYGFNPGAYDNFPAFDGKNHKLLGKIDWNISNIHKLTAKYSDYKNTQYSVISQSGGINGASGTGIVSYVPRFGTSSMGFSNENYSQEDKVKSASLELNSNWRGKFANQFIGTYTRITTFKGHDGATFPFVDIIGMTPADKTNYMSFGNEPFNANNNKVVNDVFTFTDNFTYFAGKHTLTAGANYEYQKVGNMFMPGSQGYYVYGSLDDFINNRGPKLFSLNYSLVPGQDAVYSANLKVGQLGFYLQDDYVVNPRLKVTAGIRVDAPIFPQAPLENPAITTLPLLGKNGQTTSYNDGQWPKGSLYFSPRISARWDVKGDKSLIVRGGSGIFTGRIPFVFLTNSPSTSGMYTFGALVTGNAAAAFKFNPDAHAYNPFYNKGLDPTLFPTKAGSVAPGSFAVLDRNFKFPQVWRTDLAVDKQVGGGWTLTGEALFTKDINDPFLRNAALKAPDQTVTVGPNDVRGYYSTANGNASRYAVNSKISQAIVLENASKGYSLALTAQAAKSFSNGFYASLAYTYTLAKDLSANPGSQAPSAWSANVTSGTLNDQQLSYSSYAVPHRIVGTFSYRLEYARHLASTFSLYYEGATLGRFSYVYSGDINNDGYNSSDLMYIPKDPSEINFVALPANGTTPAFTAQQQSDAFFKYIAQDKYLSSHMGQTSKRNAVTYPWYHRVDFSFAQDLFTNIGKDRNTLQFNVSIINLLNLLDHNWGVKKFYVLNNPLKVNKIVNGVPYYTMQTYNGALLSQTYINDNSTNSTWGLQIGLKYIF